MPRGWFSYNGATGSNADLAAGNYNYLEGVPFECNGTSAICAIYAYYNAGTILGPTTNPRAPLTPHVQNYIVTSRTLGVNGIPQAAKPYLYKKTL
ncbi:hypothetical protein SAMN06265348_1188 [Pedobacter westerhofensis]|uniref:Uncharacterized protein n=1 Tax=Pedobacter westerhofensis TaxID=425512 RepID=A0A521FRJ8_9SPHI|nr:hypothetical protein SAMN06265348_1188 [Pedobacter westerhofensis]